MRRYLLLAAVAVTAVVSQNNTAAGLAIALPQPGQMAINSPVVVTGKVTKVGDDTVEASSPFAGATDKQKYKIATVKVADVLAGGDKLKEIKVGYIAPVKPQPGQPPVGRPVRPPIGRPGFAMPELKEGQEMLFFLAKHPTADFYVIPNMSNPVDITKDEGKKQLDEVKKVTAVLADPAKSLKSDKADVRGEAAAIMVMKYRSYPMFGGEVKEEAIGAEESKTILKALADAEWKNVRFGGPPNAMQAFYQLGLNEKDGWIQPQIVNVPGQPAPDYTVIMKDAFTKWLAGPGKDYKIKKVVPKATEK